MQSYYLFGAESLFNLAVLDCVKPDIDQVASVVYCMIEWKLKRQQIKLLSWHTVNTEQFHGMDENDNTKILKSGTQMEQLSNFSITATACCIQWFNICLCHTFHHLAGR
jgi:hypothetical protein